MMRNQAVADRSLAISMRFFKWSLNDPLSTPPWKCRSNQFIYFGLVVMCISLTLVLWFTEERTMYFVAEFSWNIALAICSVAKFIPLVIWQSKFVEMLYDRKRFYSVDGYTEKFDKKLHARFKLCLQIVRIYSVMLMSTMTMNWFEPLINEHHLLSIIYHTPSMWIYMLIIQYYISLTLCLQWAATTTLLFTFATDVTCQFMILRHKIVNLNWLSATILDDIKELQAHTKLLLKFTKNFQDFLLSPVIGLYASTVIGACVETYVVVESDVDVLQKMKSTNFVCTVVIQLAIHCIPVTELIAEMRNLSDAWYETNWNDTPSQRLQRLVPMLILQTQNVNDIKAFNVLVVDNMMVINVCKAAMSFLTVMRNMKQLKEN